MVLSAFIMRKVQQVHLLVNSRLDSALAEITDLKAEIADLKKEPSA